MSGRGDCRQRRDQQNDHLDSARTERNRTGNGDEGACCQTTRPRCAVQGQASPKGLSRQESRHCPPRQQNGQDRRSAETARRRHLKGAHEGDRMAAPLGPRLFERHTGEEDEDACGILQKRRRSARLPHRFQITVPLQRRRAILPGGVSFSPTCSFGGAQPGQGQSAKGRSGFDPHQHHQVEHPVFGPAPQPTHAPVVEPGAQRNRCAKAKVFRLHLHVVFCPSFAHTQSSLCACGRASPTGRRKSGAGRQGLRHDLRGCLQTRNRPKPTGGIVVGVGPRRVPHRKASITRAPPGRRRLRCWG